MCDDDGAYQLFISTASVGEEQGGWENEQIAALTEDEEFAAKIRRHGEDESKHGRLFHALLKKRGIERLDVPPEFNYTQLLEKRGIGLSHERLREKRPLSDEEILKYLVHSRVTEQRAAEEVARQCAIFGDDPDMGRALRMIDEDEKNHLSYANEELQRFSDRGHADLIRRMLKQYALAEIATHRDVALAVMGRAGQQLRWSALQRGLLTFGVHALYWFERLWGWRRTVRIHPPERPNAMAPRENLHSPARTA